MRRLHLLVEGQTEESLSRNVFTPYLEARGWVVSTSILVTKRLASGVTFHGGVGSWEKIRWEITRLLRGNFDVVTTIIDYYGFPASAPGMDNRPAGPPHDRVQHVEQALGTAIGDPRFVPHLTLHETETWVFAAAGSLAELLDNAPAADRLHKIAEGAGGPELINDNPATAPSVRLLQHVPAYQKTLHGPLSVEDLGLPSLRSSCPHLDAWLAGLERRAG